MLIVVLYSIGFIISAWWCLRMINRLKRDIRITTSDYVFVVISSMFSWVTVIIFAFRYYFGSDANVMSRGYKKKKKEYNTHRLKVDD